MEAHHVRSTSVPSKQHPLFSEYDEQLCRLRSSEAASSSSTVVCKLTGLEELHDCVDNLLCLPLNQQALCKEQNQKCLDEILDGSLRVLDVCNTVKDVLLQTKEATQELQSVMRRRSSAEAELSSEIKKFLASRKVMKKALHKAMEKRCNFSPLSFLFLDCVAVRKKYNHCPKPNGISTMAVEEQSMVFVYEEDSY